MFLLVVFAVSLGAGLLGSLLGLGGGIIVIPVLTLLLHVDIRYAIGASIISVIATSSGAAATYGHVSFVVSDTGIGISGAIGLVGFTGASVALADGADVPGIAAHMGQHNGHMGGGPGTTQGTDTGPYHDQMQAAAATALGITVDDLNTQLTAGKTILWGPNNPSGSLPRVFVV